MLYTTKAIVLKKVKYAETSYITHMFTLEQGHQTFIITRGKGKSKNAPSLLFPLSIVEINAYLNPKKQVQSLKSIHLDEPFQSIPYSSQKMAIAQFLAEFYFECIKTEIENRSLFNFLKTSIEILDIIENNVHLFHIKNLMDLSKQMGFGPTNNHSVSHAFFNVMDGKFHSNNTEGCFERALSEELSGILSISDIQNHQPSLPVQTGKLVNLVISYYEMHLPGFKKPKSLEVFRMLM